MGSEHEYLVLENEPGHASNECMPETSIYNQLKDVKPSLVRLSQQLIIKTRKWIQNQQIPKANPTSSRNQEFRCSQTQKLQLQAVTRGKQVLLINVSGHKGE
ncbi:hypothetical protein SADUNF_Sadunf06G0176100 [Salix dunnii]|uniref:Uncharacterized protein n=1 Tax=Salix dunnii TaxID=1413687 RepID=A0A835MW04_9ROSI|nr:hypothetical protein SADUNF_Sadunf06G0176100 [Salix dunnii]